MAQQTPGKKGTSTSKPITAVKCPICGEIRAKEPSKCFSHTHNPGDAIVLTRILGGGKIPGTGKGYRGSADMATKPTTIDSINIKELVTQGTHPQLLQNLKDNVLIVVRELINEGVINKGQI